MIESMNAAINHPSHDTISTFVELFKLNRPRTIVSVRDHMSFSFILISHIYSQKFVSSLQLRGSPLRISIEKDILESRRSLGYYVALYSLILQESVC